MWITQAAYLETQRALLQAIAERDAIRQQQAALTTTNDWLMHRVTQLERERAKMIEVNYGVKLDVPVITHDSAARIAGVGQFSDQVLMQSINFDDMGDEEAARQGISWNEDGSLVYGTTNG